MTTWRCSASLSMPRRTTLPARRCTGGFNPRPTPAGVPLARHIKSSGLCRGAAGHQRNRGTLTKGQAHSVSRPTTLKDGRGITGHAGRAVETSLLELNRAREQRAVAMFSTGGRDNVQRPSLSLTRDSATEPKPSAPWNSWSVSKRTRSRQYPGLTMLRVALARRQGLQATRLFRFTQ